MERFKVLLIMLIGMVMSIITPLNTAQAESLTSDFAYPLANQEGQLARSIEQLESEDYGYHISQYFNTTYAEGYWSCDEDGNCTWMYGHDGIDISNYASGSPVYASADGHVVHAASSGGWGNMVRIRHLTSDGFRYTQYGHMLTITVGDGVEVSQGDQIGTIGNTGFSGGPHLHFGVLTADQSGNGYYYGAEIPYQLDPVQFVEDHQIDCTDYATQINAVKTSYGSFIGSATNEPHLYYQNGEYSDNVCIQDYDDSGTSDGTSAILFDSEGGARQAYLVRSGFWSHYSNVCGGPEGNCNQNGVVDCGAPINDEYAQSGGTARQDFQSCYLYWNGTTASANPYPEVAPGWFDGSGWQGEISYAFAEAYERNGSRNDMGEPYDMVDGAGVHRWGNDHDLPYVQDFNGGSYGWSILMYNEAYEDAYLIRTGFWSRYMNGGPDRYGYPCEDEHTVSGKTEQEFQYATMRWTGSKTKLRRRNDSDACVTPDRTISASAGVSVEQTAFDDYPDLLVYYPTIGGWWLARNNGINTGSSATYYANLVQGMFTQGSTEGWYLPQVMDLDGDSYDSIVTYTQAGDWAELDFDLTGSGDTVSTITSSYGGTTTFYYPYHGDFDGDGLEDALLYASSGDYYVRLSDGSSFTWSSQDWMSSCSCGAQSSPESSYMILIGDINGDSLDDVVIYGVTEGAWYGAPSDGVDNFGLTTWKTSFGTQGIGEDWYHPLIGDVNGDGMADIGVATAAGWYMALSTGSSFQAQSTWYGIELGSAATQFFLKDMNGDGKDDAVTFASNTGTWQVAYSTGSAFAWPPTTLITDFGTDSTGNYGVIGYLGYFVE